MMSRKPTGKKIKKKLKKNAPKKKASLKKKMSVSEALQDWPLQRETLWRPDRFKYLSQTKTDDRCVFCLALAIGKKPETLIVKKGTHVSLFLNKFPYNNGHLLVIPNRHVSDLSDLNDVEFLELHSMLRDSIDALRNCYEKGPEGFNVGLNLGRVAGAGIPGHIHYHVIPRWLGDSNFFPIIGGTKVISETLEQTYQRLLPYLG